MTLLKPTWGWYKGWLSWAMPTNPCNVHLDPNRKQLTTQLFLMTDFNARTQYQSSKADLSQHIPDKCCFQDCLIVAWSQQIRSVMSELCNAPIWKHWLELDDTAQGTVSGTWAASSKGLQLLDVEYSRQPHMEIYTTTTEAETGGATATATNDDEDERLVIITICHDDFIDGCSM